MTNQPSTPPDRAETVHYSQYNKFGISNDNAEVYDEEWRAATNEAYDVHTLLPWQSRYIECSIVCASHPLSICHCDCHWSRSLVFV